MVATAGDEYDVSWHRRAFPLCGVNSTEENVLVTGGIIYERVDRPREVFQPGTLVQPGEQPALAKYQKRDLFCRVVSLAVGRLVFVDGQLYRRGRDGGGTIQHWPATIATVHGR